MPSLLSRLPLASGLRRVTQLSRDALAAARQAYDPERSRTYYPGESLKSRHQIAFERARWTFRHRRRPFNYYIFGLDRAGTTIDDYMSFPEYIALTSSRNWATVGEGYNYRCVLVDKLVFDRVMAALGHPTTETVAFLTPDGFERVGTREVAPLGAVLELGTFDGFCKPIDSGHGRGTFGLRVEDGTLWVNGETVSVEGLAGQLSGRTLLQRRIVQHPDLERLYPKAANTLRIATVLENGAARPLGALQRMGALGGVVDNGSAGGVLTIVDLETGRVRGRGFRDERSAGVRAVTHHPDTGVALDGFAVPMFQEALDLACRVHQDLPYFHTVGWDVAVTPDGPIMIEGNETWHVGRFLALEPGFKRQLLALYR